MFSLCFAREEILVLLKPTALLVPTSRAGLIESIMDCLQPLDRPGQRHYIRNRSLYDEETVQVQKGAGCGKPN